MHIVEQVNKLHDLAMACSESATVWKVRQDFPRYERSLRDALAFEEQAISLIEQDSSPDAELSCAILRRSAASIAIECEEYERAEQQIAHVLMSSSPPFVKDEVLDLVRALPRGRRRAFRLQLRNGACLQRSATAPITSHARPPVPVCQPAY